MNDLQQLGRRYRASRSKAEIARMALRNEVRMQLAEGMTEVEAAQAAGVDRMTIRKWRQQ